MGSGGGVMGGVGRRGGFGEGVDGWMDGGLGGGYTRMNEWMDVGKGIDSGRGGVVGGVDCCI